jgi:uncharacterized protein (TIGR03435 family)
MRCFTTRSGFGVSVCITLICAFAHAQTIANAEFEAASVKASKAPGGKAMEGGPGTSDPGRINYHDRSLAELVYIAYDIKSYQADIPSWMRDEYFDIAAKVPAGATRADVRIMLRNLLVERFHLQVGHELKEAPAYILTAGKSGSKMQAYPMQLPEDITENMPRFRNGEDKDGFLIIPPGYAIGVISTRSGLTRFSFARLPLSFLCNALASTVQQPVLDQTGLTGRYDVHLAFAKDPDPAMAVADNQEKMPEASDPAPTLFSAIERQLGLKLERKTLPIISSLSSMPTRRQRRTDMERLAQSGPTAPHPAHAFQS